MLPDGPATEPGTQSLEAALETMRLGTHLELDAADLPQARSWLEAHDRWLDWSGAVLGRAEGALLWAQYHRANDEPQQARASAGEALAYASDPRQPLALVAVHRFLGQFNTEARQFEAAEEHLQQSLTLAGACAAPFEQSLSLLEMAKLRAAQDKPDEARTLLGQVRAICEPLGARPTLERVAALEETLSSRLS
jgi:hypothetical protein